MNALFCRYESSTCDRPFRPILLIMRNTQLLACLATLSYASTLTIPFNADGIDDIPAELSHLPSELNCPTLFPTERCFREHADCFAFRRPASARSTSLLDSSNETIPLDSFYAGDAFSCDRLKAVDEGQYQDCLMAQNVSMNLPISRFG